MMSKVSPPHPLPKKNVILHNLQQDLELKGYAVRFHTYCADHHTDICIKPCQDCLKLLDQLLKKYNILSDIEM